MLKCFVLLSALGLKLCHRNLFGILLIRLMLGHSFNKDFAPSPLLSMGCLMNPSKPITSFIYSD